MHFTTVWIYFSLITGGANHPEIYIVAIKFKISKHKIYFYEGIWVRMFGVDYKWIFKSCMRKVWFLDGVYDGLQAGQRLWATLWPTEQLSISAPNDRRSVESPTTHDDEWKRAEKRGRRSEFQCNKSPDTTSTFSLGEGNPRVVILCYITSVNLCSNVR